MSILTRTEGVDLDDMNATEVSNLAAEDQVLAEARTAARALAKFWENLPEAMTEELRGVLIVRWQESLSRYQSYDGFEEELD